MARERAYRIHLVRAAEKALKKLDSKDISTLAATIDRMIANPRPAGSEKLRGRNEGYWKVPASYRLRIVCTIDDASGSVEIVWIGRRENVPY